VRQQLHQLASSWRLTRSPLAISGLLFGALVLTFGIAWRIGITLGTYNPFWGSFWAALFAGAAYSLPTGLFIGLIISRAQSEREEERHAHEVRREYARQADLLLRHLRNELLLTTETEPRNAQDSAPLRTKEMYHWVHTDPIVVLGPLVPEWEPFLSVAEDFRQAHAAFHAHGVNLDVGLLRAVPDAMNAFAPEHSSDDGFLRAVISYYIGNIIGADDSNDHAPPWVKSVLQALLDKPGLGERARNYLDARAQLNETRIRLENEIHKSDSLPRTGPPDR